MIISLRWLREEKKTLLSLHVWEFIGSSFEETWIPIIHGCLCQVWLKLAQWFWRRGFFNFVNVFSLFRNYLPLEKGGVLHLNKLESPSPKDALCKVWLKLAQWFLRRRWKCEKFTDGQTDDRRSEKLTWAFSSHELKSCPTTINWEHSQVKFQTDIL